MFRFNHKMKMDACIVMLPSGLYSVGAVAVLVFACFPLRR